MRALAEPLGRIPTAGTTGAEEVQLPLEKNWLLPTWCWFAGASKVSWGLRNCLTFPQWQSLKSL